MSPSRPFLATTALGLSLLATTATADLTAAEVWGDWRSYLEGMGYAVTASQSASGATLSVSDITVEIFPGPDIEELVMQMGALQFTELGDGSVEVVMPATMPISIKAAPTDGKPPAQFDLTYTQAGHSMIASGDASEIAYAYTADSFALNLAAVTADGIQYGPDNARFSLSGEALQSNTLVSVEQVRSYDQDMQTGALTYDIFFKDPDGVDTFGINSTLQSVMFQGTSVLPVAQIAKAQDLMPLLAAGFAFDGTFRTQGSETRTEVISRDGPTRIKTGAAASTLTVAMGADGIRYGVDAQQVQIGAQIAGLPFPLFVEMATSGFGMRLPVMQAEEPQDFALSLNMTEFTMSDIIWALFDAAGQLPRDPATVALDLSGKAKVLFDTLNPEQMGEMAASGEQPAEVHELQIDKLVVDAVGAKLEATGNMTFDNDDKTTLPGFPKPVGDVSIDMAGANGLMDRLVAMGLLPAEQVMGARMMLGLFTVPGPEADTLTSKIEFTEEGQILANGQRLR